MNKKLEKALKGFDPESLRDAVKDKTLNIRLSSKDKELMEVVADSLGLSVAEYLCQLHRIAAGKIKG